MWVLFGSFYMVPNFYQRDSQNKMCAALANLRRNICKNRTSLDLVMVIRSTQAVPQA